jgi:hypothetical protein
LTDALEAAFVELRERIGSGNRLVPTHADPFYNLVHDPRETFELHRRLPRWGATLKRDGWDVQLQSLRELCWKVVDASGRWQDWLDAEDATDYGEANRSMRTVLRDDPAAVDGARLGLARTLAPLLADTAPKRLLLLTDAAMLHPWFRVRTFETWFHDKIHCTAVLFYPGRRTGQFGLHFLDRYAEDGNYRSTIVGGLQ